MSLVVSMTLDLWIPAYGERWEFVRRVLLDSFVGRVTGPYLIGVFVLALVRYAPPYRDLPADDAGHAS